MKPKTARFNERAMRRRYIAAAIAAVTTCWGVEAIAEHVNRFAIVPLLGGTPISISPPATYLMVWSAPSGGVNTLQSADGMTWTLATTLPGPPSSGGATAAHDGDSGWMVAWNAAGALAITSGSGQFDPVTGSGIAFAAVSRTLTTTRPLSATPAIAYNGDNWLAVFRDTTGALRVIPSLLAGTPDMALGFSGDYPALAFGAGRYVLAFLAGNSLVARTSRDGICWSAPVPIFRRTLNGDSEISPRAVSLSFSQGAFYAIGKLVNRYTPTDAEIIGAKIAVFRSSDGTAWETLVGPYAGPPVDLASSGIPGATFAQCQLVLAYATRASGANVGNQTGAADLCTSPSSFSFTTATPIPGAPTAQPDQQMVVAFNHGGIPTPALGPMPRLGFNPSSLNFGTVPIGETATRALTVTNTSDDPTPISIAAAPPGPFQWDAVNGVLACGARTEVSVDFRPMSETVVQRTMTVTSDAAGNPHSISIGGRGTSSGEPR